MLTAAAFVCAVSGCAAQSGAEWVREVSYDEPEPVRGRSRGWSEPRRKGESRAARSVDRAATEALPAIEGEVGEGEPPLLVREHGRARAANAAAPADRGASQAPGTFRNTYYDFPSEGAGSKDATIFDASCVPVARVTTDFHNRVCVQGSGKLSTGATVSFARRDCACASVCPRTGQKICFERLDASLYPHGRGAMGSPITPLRTVAVDSSVIPLGTPLYIPDLAGVARPDGSLHDGCFMAEDRGIKVVGRHVDVFTGDPSVTARWNAIVPSNQGVRVFMNDPRCAGARAGAAGAGAAGAGAGRAPEN
jgi:3D (Asp-Asp-Asp) domain-containing protein